MFDWLVLKMNTTITPAEMDDPSFYNKAKTIGIFESPGFENFADITVKGKPRSTNNLEQLFNNYLDEKLIQLYKNSIL